jgi:hypothetical protein
MHKRRLIRRYINQDDIPRLIGSGQHLDVNSPYFREHCEWGLFIDFVMVFDPANMRQTNEIFSMARHAGISMVPGMRMLADSNGFGSATDLPGPALWPDLTARLERIILHTRTNTPLIDGTKRVMFDIESYAASGIEVRIDADGVDFDEQHRLSMDFFRLIKERGIVPMVHPGLLDAYLSRRLFDEAGKVGVAMLEGFGGGGAQLESYLTGYDGYTKTKTEQFLAESIRWKRHYPHIKTSWMTTEMALRKSTTAWRDNADGAWDIVQSADDLSWVFDAYRDIDTNTGDGMRGPSSLERSWMQKADLHAVPAAVTYPQYSKALGSPQHFLQSYDIDAGDLKTSNNIGLTHVWQFGNTPDLTDRITSANAQLGSSAFHDRFWHGFYSASYINNGPSPGFNEYEEDLLTIPPAPIFTIARRGIRARHFVLSGVPRLDARTLVPEPRIDLPAGIDTMDAWSVCLTLIVHGQDYGADGLTPWTRGMSLLNRWWSNNDDEYQYFYTELFALDGVAHMRLRVKFTNAAGSFDTEVRTIDLPAVNMVSHLKLKVLVSMERKEEWTWRFGCVQEMEETLPDKSVIVHYGSADPADPLSCVRLKEFQLPAGATMPSVRYGLEIGNWAALGMKNGLHDANREGFEALPEWPGSRPEFPNAVCIGNRVVNLASTGWPKSDVLQHGSLYGVEVLDCAVWNKFGTMIPFTESGGKLSGDQWPYNSWVLDEARIAGWILPDDGL